MARMKTQCSECLYPFEAAPSIAMQMGMNVGHGTCPKCNTFLAIQRLDDQFATTEPWQQYIDREMAKEEPNQ